MLKKLSFLCILMLLGINFTKGQVSNPTPHDLSSSNYSFTEWPAASAANTYPANSILHLLNVVNIGTYVGFDSTASGTFDWPCAYNIGTATRILGKGNNGISFINTGNGRNITTCATGANTDVDKMAGGMVIALNATGRQDIQVAYTNRTFATNPRAFKIQLQYRVGTTGNFTRVPGSVDYFQQALNGSKTDTVTLPSVVNNQPIVQVRWIYMQDINNAVTGGRPELGVDDITISSDVFVSAAPTMLNFVSINNGNNPTQNTNFDVIVNAVDNNNNPQAVVANTDVTLSVATGNGTLNGTISGTIPAGQSSITFSNITYSLGEVNVSFTATATAGDPLASATSSTFEVFAIADRVNIISGPQFVGVNTSVNGFLARALRPDLTTDPTYTTDFIISIQSGPMGGVLSGTTTLTPITGQATFNGLSFSLAGTYVLEITSGSLASGTFEVEVGDVSFTNTIVPQFMVRGAGGSRVPVAAFLEITGLQANREYRYINQIVDDNDASTTNGAGNLIIYNSNTNTFSRSTSPSFVTPGAHGTFITDDNGNYGGWFIAEATTNARFTAGNAVRIRVRLNDGFGGTIPVFYVTTNETITVLESGSAINQASGVRGNGAANQAIVAVFERGPRQHRPLATSIAGNLNIGLENVTDYASWWRTNTASTSGAWGLYIPNNSTRGINTITTYSISSSNVNGQTSIYRSNSGIGGWLLPDNQIVTTNNLNNGNNNIPYLNFNDASLAVTTLDASSCNVLDLVFSERQVLGKSAISAIAIPGASSYEFLFTDSATNVAVATIQRGGPVAHLIRYSNILNWGTVYYVTVRYRSGDGWSDFGTPCKIAFIDETLNPADIGTTQLLPYNCGLSNWSLAPQRVNKITKAVFSLVQNATSYIVEVFEPTQTTIISTFEIGGIGFNLYDYPIFTWGNTYEIRIRAKVGNTIGNPGAFCSITIIDQPINVNSSKIEQCERTNIAISTRLSAVRVQGASLYQYRFFNDQQCTSLYATVSVMSAAGYLTVGDITPGLLPNTTYYVTVTPFVGGIAGTAVAGDTCSITTEMAPARVGFANSSVNVYPNPSATQFNVIITSDNATVATTLFDLQGRVIERKQMATNENVYFGNNLQAGMYILQIVDGEKSESIRIIKTN